MAATARGRIPPAPPRPPPGATAPDASCHVRASARWDRVTRATRCSDAQNSHLAARLMSGPGAWRARTIRTRPRARKIAERVSGALNRVSGAREARAGALSSGLCGQRALKRSPPRVCDSLDRSPGSPAESDARAATRRSDPSGSRLARACGRCAPAPYAGRFAPARPLHPYRARRARAASRSAQAAPRGGSLLIPRLPRCR
jgi:hypothetical protein